MTNPYEGGENKYQVAINRLRALEAKEVIIDEVMLEHKATGKLSEQDFTEREERRGQQKQALADLERGDPRLLKTLTRGFIATHIGSVVEQAEKDRENGTGKMDPAMTKQWILANLEVAKDLIDLLKEIENAD